MKKQMFEPAPIKLTVESTQSFRDIVNSDAYAKDEAFIGYGNPAAKILIVGQEVTWRINWMNIMFIVNATLQIGRKILSRKKLRYREIFIIR